MATPPVGTREPTTVEKLRGLPWGVAADSANTVFALLTFFGSVFVLFLDELGLDKAQIGLQLSFFPFAGLIALFIAPAVARFGYKRTFLTFWTVRKGIAALLLLTPWVLAHWGSSLTLTFVSVIVMGFALSRAAAETGRYPWTQEYVPNQVRGKYTAVNNAFTTAVGLVTVAASGAVLARTSGLSGYMILLGAGIVFGLAGVWAYAHIPGGAPAAPGEGSWRRALREAARDGSFRNYLLGIALMTLATTPMTSFLPLFMQEQVGLPNSQVVLLQNGALVGGLASVYLWGWAADRYGSTPIMISGVILQLGLPVAWLLMPRFNQWSLAAALGIALFQGVATMGWGIGSARLLFVGVVPPAHKTDYMALYYAWIGVVGGGSQLFGGWLLQQAQGLSGRFLFLPLDPYLPLFALGLALPLVSLVCFRGVQRDSSVSLGQFAGLLFHGNPLLAMESMIRYHLARDEQATVHLTERLGQARSLLTVEELLESLADPRFNVRFEAIVAIGRTRSDEQLVDALAEVLHSADPALSVMAAWALGRLGDSRAQTPLRRALDAEYRSIRAHSARALGTLGDDGVAPVLLDRLQRESDAGLRLAYAAALGQLQAPAAVPLLLPMLQRETASMARSELALALARQVGQEHLFVQLMRQARADAGTTFARAILAQARRLPAAAAHSGAAGLAAAAAAFGAGQMEQGVARFVQWAHRSGPALLAAPAAQIWEEAVARLQEGGAARLEYLLLALHVLAQLPADDLRPPAA